MNFQQRKANNTGKAIFSLIMNPQKSISDVSAELCQAQQQVDEDEKAYNESLLALASQEECDMYPHS